jgi:hypothetical protein
MKLGSFYILLGFVAKQKHMNPVSLDIQVCHDKMTVRPYDRMTM